MDTKILDVLEEYFNEEFELVRHDLTALETVVKEKMRLLGQGLLQRRAQRAATEQCIEVVMSE